MKSITRWISIFLFVFILSACGGGTAEKILYVEDPEPIEHIQVYFDPPLPKEIVVGYKVSKYASAKTRKEKAERAKKSISLQLSKYHNKVNKRIVPIFKNAAELKYVLKVDELKSVNERNKNLPFLIIKTNRAGAFYGSYRGTFWPSYLFESVVYDKNEVKLWSSLSTARENRESRYEGLGWAAEDYDYFEDYFESFVNVLLSDLHKDGLIFRKK